MSEKIKFGNNEQEPTTNIEQYDNTKSSTKETRSTRDELVENEKRKGILEKAKKESNDLSKDSKEFTDKINSLEESSNKSSDINPGVSKKFQKTVLNKELKHIQKKLKPIDKAGSKIIHNDVVSTLSEPASKTIFRPSGLLGAGIIGLIGSTIYYIYAKKLGLFYNYNYYLLFFLIGFIIGIGIEYLFKIIKRNKATL